MNTKWHEYIMYYNLFEKQECKISNLIPTYLTKQFNWYLLYYIRILFDLKKNVDDNIKQQFFFFFLISEIKHVLIDVKVCH